MNFTGRIIKVTKCNTPGAWDNWALPEFYYMALAIDESGNIQQFSVPEGTVPDASPELNAQYEALMAAEQAERDAEEAEREANIPKKGKQVRIVKGRKHPIGAEGRVFWYGNNQYGYSCGIELIDGKRIFTAVTNVIVIGEAA